MVASLLPPRPPAVRLPGVDRAAALVAEPGDRWLRAVRALATALRGGRLAAGRRRRRRWRRARRVAARRGLAGVFCSVMVYHVDAAAVLAPALDAAQVLRDGCVLGIAAAWRLAVVGVGSPTRPARLARSAALAGRWRVAGEARRRGRGAAPPARQAAHAARSGRPSC